MKTLKNKQSALKQLGIVHIRINEILVSKELLSIPVPMMKTNSLKIKIDSNKEIINESDRIHSR